MKKLISLLFLLAGFTWAGEILQRSTTVTIPVGVDSLSDSVWVSSLKDARGVIGRLTITPVGAYATPGGDSLWKMTNDSLAIRFRSAIGNQVYELESSIKIAIPGNVALNCLVDTLMAEKLYFLFNIYDSVATSDTATVLPKYRIDATYKLFKD
jgi:hypothetical protein